MQDFLEQWNDNNDYIIAQTSGTTGSPKIIKLKKSAMIASAKATADFFGLKKGDTALLCLSPNYIAGKMMIVRSEIIGLTLDVVNPDSHPLKSINKKYKFVAMVPMQVENSINKLHLIDILIVGGAKMNDELRSKLKNVDCNIYETYGMTETVSHIALKNIKDEFFTPLPNVNIAVDQRGCLVIDAPFLLDNTLVTNDLVEVKENKFKWLGRIDNVINSGGVKLFPEQIEQKIKLPISRRFFVCGVKDDYFGEKLILVIEGDEFPIKKEVFSNLNKYEIPKDILFIDKFSETETGKIIRRIKQKEEI